MKIVLKMAAKIILIGIAVLIVIFVFYFLKNSARQNSSYFPGSANSSIPSSTDVGPSEGFSVQNPFSLGNTLQSSRKIASTGSSSDNSLTNTQDEGALTKRKIIKNGQLSIVVKNIELSSQQITDIAKRTGGYIQNSSVNKGVAKELKKAIITLRIPAEDFEDVFKNIKSLAEDVEKEETVVTDMGEKYTDLQAQLKNLEAEEAQYQKIMGQAITINDTLQVSQKLSGVRGQIETIKGQIQYLDRQIDMSTLTIDINSESEVKILGIKWKPILNIKRTARSMLSGVTGFIDFMVKVIIYLPLIALIGGFILIVFLIVRKLYRWVKNGFFLKNQ